MSMTDPHAPEGNTDYTTGAPPNDFPEAAAAMGMKPLGMREGTSPDEMIRDPMEYIDTDDPAKVRAFQSINQACYETYRAILEDAPPSAERTLAIRKLQEARMWANAAVVFDGRRYRL